MAIIPVSLSTQGTLLAYSSQSWHRCGIWPITPQRNLCATWLATPTRPLPVPLAPDSNYLVSAGFLDRSVRLWDVHSGALSGAPWPS
ncbi:MAG: hypothetical protein R2867_26565 [Caldilineaceae bacterium]